ncbi:Na+/H+ antiporter subunit B [Ignavibacteriales bacterium]
MSTLILRTAVKFIIPGMFLFSLFLLFRGHNEPGGGFVGGLVAAAAVILYTLANGVEMAEEMLHVSPQMLMATGLLMALLAGITGWVAGKEFMTGIWLDVSIPVMGKFGTPVLFDIGVYLLVTGMVVKVIFTLADTREGENQ